MPALRKPRRSPALRPDAAAMSTRQFHNRLIQVMYERRVKCPYCRYSLDGIPGPRCPECGSNVTEVLRIADTLPHRLRNRVRMRAKIAIVVLVLVIAASVSAGLALMMQ